MMLMVTFTGHKNLPWKCQPIVSFTIENITDSKHGLIVNIYNETMDW